MVDKGLLLLFAHQMLTGALVVGEQLMSER
jgi:hypothetical protein